MKIMKNGNFKYTVVFVAVVVVVILLLLFVSPCTRQVGAFLGVTQTSFLYGYINFSFYPKKANTQVADQVFRRRIVI